MLDVDGVSSVRGMMGLCSREYPSEGGIGSDGQEITPVKISRPLVLLLYAQLHTFYSA